MTATSINSLKKQIPSNNAQAASIDNEKLIPLPKLWAEMAMFPVWDTTAALKCFMAGLCSLLKARDATWMVMRKQSKLPREISGDHYHTIFKAMKGWSPVAAEYLNPEKVLKRIADRWLMHARKEGLDPISLALLDEAGKFTRTYIRHDVATDQEWQDHWVSKNFQKFYGIGERMIACTPLNERCESFLIIDRPMHAEPFTPEDRDFMSFAIASVPRLHKLLCLERGLLGSSAVLSNREIDTYRLLLADFTESEIAEKLKLSTHTIHDYARQLYQKFGVKGRVGLMAMVLEF
jgi:DNA-binding CsgD family transcriptional regulator